MMSELSNRESISVSGRIRDATDVSRRLCKHLKTSLSLSSSIEMVRIPLQQSPGEVVVSREEVSRDAESTETIEIVVKNAGYHFVQVWSGYHSFEVTPELGFDRKRAYGKRLDIPAGDRVHFPPGETKRVELVGYGGGRRIRSFYGVLDGPIADQSAEEALSRLCERIHRPLAKKPD